MYKILIVEDDFSMAKTLKKQIEAWGDEAELITEFKNVLKIFIEYNPHFVLLDINLPYFNGYHWCGEIRKISDVPILFISSISENMNIVMAMNMGADDFIIKPFDLDVLIVKIKALLRRTYDLSGKTPALEHNGVVLNLNDMSIIYGENKIELTKNDFRILQTLMENKGKVVSRNSLMIKLWENDEYVEENTLTVNIARLRKKLEAAGLPEFIKTKSGTGYILA